MCIKLVKKKESLYLDAQSTHEDLFRPSCSRAAQFIQIIKWRRSSVFPASSPIPPAPRCSLRNATHARRNLSLVCCTGPLIFSGRRQAAGQSLDITRKSSSSMFIDPKAVSLCHKNDRGTRGVPDRLWCSACVHLRMSEYGPHHYAQHVYLTICLMANALGQLKSRFVRLKRAESVRLIVIGKSLARITIAFDTLKIESQSKSHYECGQSVLVTSPSRGPWPDYIACNVYHCRT